MIKAKSRQVFLPAGFVIIDKRTNVRYNELTIKTEVKKVNLKRIIFHIDVNSAFLSWTAVHMLKNGANFDPRTVPSVIGGSEASRHGIVLAKSTPASKYNIKTGEPLAKARRKYPKLVVLPPTNEVYIEESRKMIKLLQDYSPCIERFSIDECFLDYTNMKRHFGEPLEAAHTIQKRIYNELGFTVNIGISSNKLLAKMASDLSKPNKIHTLYPNEIKEKMWPLPVKNLFMVGHRTTPKLNAMGIRTIGDLANADLELLKFKFKKYGVMIWNYANGIDESPVITDDVPPKSMGISKTTSKDLHTFEQAAALILSLTETLARRLRKYGYTAGGITLSLRSYDMIDYSHQMKLYLQTQCTNTIYQNALILFKNAWNGLPLRKVGISLWSLQCDKIYQYDIWDSYKNDKWIRLDKAIDRIKQRFGENAITRCSFIKDGENDIKESVKVVAFAPKFNL